MNHLIERYALTVLCYSESIFLIIWGEGGEVTAPSLTLEINDDFMLVSLKFFNKA